MSNNNQNPPNAHQTYANYISLAINTARKLSVIIRETNKLALSPKSGKDLYEMPVYEPINLRCPCNLYTYTTAEVITTTLTVVYENPKYVDAFFRRYKNSSGKEQVHIIVTDQNPCWTRFLATKEIMHCHVHETGDETNSHSDLKNLIISIINETGTSSDTAQSVVDDAAYFGAVEYLIPYDTVPLLNKVLDALKNNSATENEAYLILAKRIRVPESILEFRLNNNEIFNIK